MVTCLWRASLVSIGLVLLASAAQAQSTTLSGIEGRVVDETGAALPGVTVTITSPALQAPQVVTVTDEEGHFRFTNLPAGVYSATYDLAGFAAVRREGLQVGVGFVVTLAVEMKVGGIQETLVVSGASPTVDIRTTSVTTNVTAQMLETLPMAARSVTEVVKLTPGTRIETGGGVDVGGSSAGNTPAFKTYGSDAGGFSLMLDGLETGGVFRYYDLGSVGEIQVRALAKSPEYALGGGQVYAVLKSGGNEFHGGGMAQWQGENLQSNNIDDELRAKGVTQGNSIQRYYDADLSFGGPIKRNRAWFFAGGHWQGRRNYLTGYSAEPGPDNVFFTRDDVPGLFPIKIVNYAAKGTVQLTTKQRLESFYNYNNKITPEQGASALRPRPSTAEYLLPSDTYKMEWTYTPTDRSLLNILVGRTAWDVKYNAYSDLPTSFDNVTTQWSGAGFIAADHAPPSGAPNGNTQARIGYQYFLGQHDLKVGADLSFKNQDRYSLARVADNGGVGNDFAQYFNNGTPFEVYLFNSPNHAFTTTNEQGVYVRDNWRASDRLTLNLGLRWHRAHTYFPDQSTEVSAFCSAPSFSQRPESNAFCNVIEYPKQTVYDWPIFSPRVGISYALTADNRTAVKVTYGRYGFNREGRANNTFNKNAFGGLRYSWNDVDGDSVYDHPTELGVFVRTEGAAGRTENPDLEQPTTQDVSVHLERELLPSLMGRIGYVYKRETRLFQEVNVLRPYDVYNIRIDATDPGPDGVLATADDGGALTYYDFDPAFAGRAFESFVNTNTDHYDNQYHNLEFVLDRRFSGRWQLLGIS